MTLQPFPLALAAIEAFTEHVSRQPAASDKGEAIAAWANRASELSRAAADAAAEYADESYRLGQITTGLLADRLIEAEAFHSGNQRIVRKVLAGVARAREGAGSPP